MRVLVAYDIAKPRRLKRVAAIAEHFGTRVQKSIFECSLSAGQLDLLVAELRAAVNRRADRIHIYVLCAKCSPERREDPGFTPEQDDVYIL